jgi:hypothetical protein
VPFRRAHEIVGALVRKLVAERREFESLSLTSARGGDRFEADIAARVTPACRLPPVKDAAIDGSSGWTPDCPVRQWLDGAGKLC